METAKKPIVAVINTSIELIDALTYALQREGYEITAVTVYELKKGLKTLDKVFGTSKPHVIIYDVALPYQENWNFLQNLKGANEIGDARVIITTTNKKALETLIGEKTQAFEITGVVGKPFDLDDILQAVAIACKDVDKERSLVQKHDTRNLSGS